MPNYVFETVTVNQQSINSCLTALFSFGNYYITFCGVLSAPSAEYSAFCRVVGAPSAEYFAFCGVVGVPSAEYFAFCKVLGAPFAEYSAFCGVVGVEEKIINIIELFQFNL